MLSHALTLPFHVYIKTCHRRANEDNSTGYNANEFNDGPTRRTCHLWCPKDLRGSGIKNRRELHSSGRCSSSLQKQCTTNCVYNGGGIRVKAKIYTKLM